jgi:hypothetical protein
LISHGSPDAKGLPNEACIISRKTGQFESENKSPTGSPLDSPVALESDKKFRSIDKNSVLDEGGGKPVKSPSSRRGESWAIVVERALPEPMFSDSPIFSDFSAGVEFYHAVQSAALEADFDDKLS